MSFFSGAEFFLMITATDNLMTRLERAPRRALEALTTGTDSVFVVRFWGASARASSPPGWKSVGAA